MESMREYTIRRALETKRYEEVAEAAGIGGHSAVSWLQKFARGIIPNPGADRVEKLFHYYKSLELNVGRR